MLEPTDAMILLVPVLPLAVWAAMSDLKRMKIPNASSFFIFGPGTPSLSMMKKGDTL